MEETNQQSAQNSNACKTCGCMGHGHCCGCGHHHGHFVLRWLLGILLLAIVFALGVKVGEFKSGLRGGNGRMYYRSWGMMPGQGMPMMYGGGAPGNMMYMRTGTSTPTTTITPAK